MKKYFFSILFFLIIIAIYSYNLFASFNFHPDFARDIYDMLKIIQGKLTLIGPKSSFGGVYSGPFYYYLFVPIFYLTKLNIYSLLIFNLTLFLFALVFFYIQITKRYGLLSGFLSTLVIAFLPIYITHSRSPWNGSTYLPFLLIFFTFLYFNKFEKNNLGLFFLGFLAGFISTIDLLNLPLLALLTVYLFYFLNRKINIIPFFVGIILAFSPLILFELKHNFIMFKNTFISGSYKNFIENKNIPNAVSGNKNILKNVLFISDNLSSQLGVNLLFYFSLFIIFWKRINKVRIKFFILSIFAFVFLYSLFLRYQFGQHYLFPLSLYIIFIVTITLLTTKYKWLLIVILFFEIYSFPKGIYNTSYRKPEKYEKTVKYIIDNKLLQKNEAFNLIQYSKEYKIYVPIGHEYRFFFVKNKFLPKSEFEYKSSNTLLIFSEVKNFDITKLNSWEIDQFGKKYLQKSQKYQIGDIILYKIRKAI